MPRPYPQPTPQRWVSRSLTALVISLAAALAWGQPQLPPAAAEALQRGQQLAAEALVTYPRHFPDHALWAAAIAEGRAAAREAPDHPAPQRFLAQVYVQTGWHIRAWQAWQAFLDLGGTLDASSSSQLVESALWLGIMAQDQGRPAEASTYLETVAALDPGMLVARERLARILIAAENWSAALPHLEALGDDLPDDMAAARVRARETAAFGSLAAAAAEAGRAAAADGAWQQALDHFESAVAANDAFLDAWRGVAAAATALGRPAVAATALERVLQLSPGDEAASTALAVAQAQLAVGVAAQQAFERGLAAYRAGNLNAARIAFQEATAHNRSYVDAYAFLGRVALETGDPATAVARYRTAVALAPGRADLREGLRVAEARSAAAASAAEVTPAAPADLDPAASQADVPGPAAPGTEAEPVVAAIEPPDEPDREDAADAPGPHASLAPAAVITQPTAPATLSPTPPDVPAGATLHALDARVDHLSSASGGTGAFTFLPVPDLNRDLSEYVGGRLHLNVEVGERPSDEPLLYQLCLVSDDIRVPPSCTDARALQVTEPGSFDLATPVARLSHAADADWSRGMKHVMLVLRGPDGNPIDDRLLPGQTTRSEVDATNYYPMTVRVRAALVPTGQAFAGWP